MLTDAASRQTFGKNSVPGFQGRMTLTGQGLVLGAGTLLGKLDNNALLGEADQERIWMLLTVAYGQEVPLAVLGSLRRVAKHWQGGDKCLAAIHLAQMGLPEIGEDAAYRLSLAAELIDAGVAPHEVARELGFDPPAGLIKFDPDQPRVPAGSGRESGQWTTSGDAASGDAATGSPLTEGRSAGANSGKVNQVYTRPKDAIYVTRPDGSKIYDPDSTTKRLMAPPRANFQDVYAAGERTANWPLLQQIDAARTALGQFGTYDFQRDEATNTANYAVGVYMAGAGYGLYESLAFAQAYAVFNSSNAFDDKYKGREWKIKGWEDAHRGDWR